jgi:molybdopterin-binding protein
MTHPVKEFVAFLIGVENLLSGTVVEKNENSFIADVSGKEIEAKGSMEPEALVILCIRPENVILPGLASGNPVETENTIPAKVVKITPMGAYQKVQLNCGFPLVVYVNNLSFSELSLKEGTEVLASFKAKAVHGIRKT